MTLIFLSEAENCPVFLGADCLTSNTDSGDDVLDLPSARNQDAIELGALKSQLVKKLYVLHKHFAVCWCKRIIEAANFLKELRQFIDSDSQLSGKDIYEKAVSLLESGDYKGLAIIIAYYDTDQKQVLSYDYGCEHAVFPILGNVKHGGTGSSLFVKQANALETTENVIGEAQPRELSQLRAMSLCFNFFTSECVSRADSGEFPLFQYFGGAFEFCYWDEPALSFFYINNITLLMWFIKYETRPHYSSYFGHAPRTQEENDKQAFYTFKTIYSDNGYTIERYKNIGKTNTGHIVEKSEYKIYGIVDSIFPRSTDENLKYFVNFYYVIGTDIYNISNRYMHIVYEPNRPWIELNPTTTPLVFELTLNPIASSTSKSIIHSFMRFRYLTRTPSSEVSFDPAELANAHNIVMESEHYFDLGEDMKAACALKKAITIFQRNNDRYGIAETKNHLGSIYFRNNKTDFATSLFIEALNESKIIGALHLYAQAAYNLGVQYKKTLLDRMKLGIMDYWLNKESKRLLVEAYGIFEEVNDLESKCETINMIAHHMIIFGYRNEALQEINKALVIANQLGSPKLIEQCSNNRKLVLSYPY